MRWASSVAFGCLTLANAGVVPASSPSQVLLNDTGNRELGRKIRAELLDAGFSVLDGHAVSLRPGADTVPVQAGNALIRVASAEQVELYIAGASERDAYSQALRRRGGEAQSFALRVVEELRARLVDLGISDHRPATATATPDLILDQNIAVSPAAASPGMTAGDRSTTLWLSGGVGGVWATGGIGPILDGALGASLELGGNWQVGIAALVPLSEGDVSGPEGEAEVYVGSVAAELSSSQKLSAAWSSSVGAGAGVLVVSSYAETSRPFLAREDRLFAGLYYLHGGLTWALSDTVRLRAGVVLGVSAPRPVLRFDQRDVASFGPAFGGLVLRAELGWPVGVPGPP